MRGLGGMVVNHPPATPADRPLCQAFHEALGLPAAATTGGKNADAALSALTGAIGSHGDAERRAARRQLTLSLNDLIAPGQVERATIANLRVISLYGHLRDPAPPLGRPADRERILDELLEDAEALPDATGRREAATAALLLAMQEGFLFGNVWLRRILRRPTIVEKLPWPGERLSALDAELSREQLHMAQLVGLRIDALRIINALEVRASSEFDPDGVSKLIDALERLLAAARHRPVYQWHVANMTWLAVNLAAEANRGDDIAAMRNAQPRWRDLQPDGPFGEWISEAFVTPWPASKVPRTLLLTVEQLRARTRLPRPPAI